MSLGGLLCGHQSSFPSHSSDQLKFFIIDEHKSREKGRLLIPLACTCKKSRLEWDLHSKEDTSMAVSLMCPAALRRQPCDTTEMGIEVKAKLKGERMETGKEEAESKAEMIEGENPVIWQGKSLMASRKVEMGEVLLLEAAVLELSPEKAAAVREVEKKVEMLGKEELQRLILLQKRFPVNCYQSPTVHVMMSSTRLATMEKTSGRDGCNCTRTIEDIFFSRAVSNHKLWNIQKLSPSLNKCEVSGLWRGRLVKAFPNNCFPPPLLPSYCCLAGPSQDNPVKMILSVGCQPSISILASCPQLNLDLINSPFSTNPILGPLSLF